MCYMVAARNGRLCHIVWPRKKATKDEIIVSIRQRSHHRLLMSFTQPCIRSHIEHQCCLTTSWNLFARLIIDIPLFEATMHTARYPFLFTLDPNSGCP